MIGDPSSSILSSIRGELLSEHYLRTQLAARDDWKNLGDDPRAAPIEALFEKVKRQLEKNKPESKGSNESAVRDHLLNPVFEILGLRWSPGVLYFTKQLDYALFPDEAVFTKAQSLINDGKELDALRLSCGIVEAERWGKELGNKPERSDLTDPIFQVEFYLGNARRSGGPRWGILTNGHTWRLYCADSDPLRHDFLEIELPTGPSLFSQDEREAFKLLVYFFSVEALERGGRLDKIYEDATRQAAGITAELRRQAFGAVELIASAIMRAAPKTSASLAYEAALIQLFRLLFILKAEADGLLRKPKVSGDIAERIIKNNGESIGGGEWEPGKSFWHELHDIFEAIATEYNGHLFQSKPATAEGDGADYFAPARALLESVTLPNQAVANAIDRLLRVYQPNGQGRFHALRVDYSTLRVRELGTIYEGLLEWRLEPVSATDLKAGSVRLLGDKRIKRKLEPGDYTLVADQSDRKATGSYYTPHYVVKFIGENILKPLLQEIEQECQGDPARIITRVLDQRILDPAMGSGHFLVFAVEHLAGYVFDQLGKLRATVRGNGKGKKKGTKAERPLPLDASIDFIRARIAERCIYGVDINPLAVELAKLSLWIATAAKGIPLSFLDHHLRCGDSLLGVSSQEFHHDLFAQKLVQQMKLAVEHIRWINELYTQTLDDIGKKEDRLRAARQFLRRFRLTYDCQLAPAFGVETKEGFHAWLDGVMEPVPRELPPWLQQVEKLAAEFRFFHWELEFPEVWRDRFGRPLPIVAAVYDRRPCEREKRRSQSAATAEERLAGFDVILGNPPFVRAKNEQARGAYMERWATAIKGFHLLVPFFERAFALLRLDGQLGFIVSNAFAKREFGKKLVEEFLPQFTLDEVVDCSGLMFPGHGTPTCIVFGRAVKPSEDGAVKVTATLKGDLRTPPEDSPLWHSAVARHSQPRYRDEWISVTERPRVELETHPWIFSDVAQRTLDKLRAVRGVTLESLCAEPIGAQFITGADDVYVLPSHLARRLRMPVDHLRRYATGEDVRDWEVWPSAMIVFPYDEALEPLGEPLPPSLDRFLAPYRQHLENLIISGTTPKRKTHLKWFEYRRLARAKLQAKLNIVFPQISMYNHARLSDHSIAFKEKAQAIVLTEKAAEETWQALTGLLNSSSLLFILKQVCFNKGPGKRGEQDRYEFSGNILGQVRFLDSLSSTFPYRQVLVRHVAASSARAAQLGCLRYSKVFDMRGEAYDGWNRALPGYTAPHPLIAQPFDTGQQLLGLKAKAREERERLRREMIALQEETDWLVYSAYQLLPQAHPAVGLGVMDGVHPWEVALGQRPFELAAIHAGPPADWDEKRRALWLARLEAIRTNEHVARIEQPVYKRRWVPPDYEKEFAEAFKWWLREKAEYYLEHGAEGGPVSLEDWASALWKDSRVRAAAEAFYGAALAGAAKFEPILKEAVEEETVPDDETAFKTRHKQLRGKLNVPRERFRSLTAKPGYYIWAGKTGQNTNTAM
jgi:hypothetical protein